MVRRGRHRVDRDRAQLDRRRPRPRSPGARTSRARARPGRPSWGRPRPRQRAAHAGALASRLARQPLEEGLGGAAARVRLSPMLRAECSPQSARRSRLGVLAQQGAARRPSPPAPSAHPRPASVGDSRQAHELDGVRGLRHDLARCPRSSTAPVDITRPSDTSGEDAARRSIAPSISTCSAPWPSIASLTARTSAAALGPATSTAPGSASAWRSAPRRAVFARRRASSSCGMPLARSSSSVVATRLPRPGAPRLLDAAVDHVVLLAVAPDGGHPDRARRRPRAREAARPGSRSCRCSWPGRPAPAGAVAQQRGCCAGRGVTAVRRSARLPRHAARAPSARARRARAR